jgi:hypothetical protein
LVRFNDTRDFRILAIMVCILELELGIAKAFVFGIVIGMALWPLVCSIAIYPVHYFEKLFCWFYTDVLRVMHGLRSIPLQSWCGAIPRERAKTGFGLVSVISPHHDLTTATRCQSTFASQSDRTMCHNQRQKSYPIVFS